MGFVSFVSSKNPASCFDPDLSHVGSAGEHFSNGCCAHLLLCVPSVSQVATDLEIEIGSQVATDLDI